MFLLKIIQICVLCGSPKNDLPKHTQQLLIYFLSIDPFPKRDRLVHNSGFPKIKALYFSQNMVNSTEISQKP